MSNRNSWLDITTCCSQHTRSLAVYPSAFSSSCFGAYFGGKVLTEKEWDKRNRFFNSHDVMQTCIWEIWLDPVIPHLHIHLVLVVQAFHLRDHCRRNFSKHFSPIPCSTARRTPLQLTGKVCPRSDESWEMSMMGKELTKFRGANGPKTDM